mgnify:CR=1 FL=1|tara:strand:- start:9038 stop:10036 length:999 start_codon:yes stop_codon:yes gene_type:complete
MRIEENFPIKDLNSLRVNQFTKYFCSIKTIEECKKAIEFSKAKDVPFLFIGAGSNVVFTSDYEGLLIRNNILGRIEHDDKTVEILSGENWHEFVEWSLANERYGLENLALIPGTVGASPIQNIGAYGKEVSTFIKEVKAVNTLTAKEKTFSKEDCKFGYRSSLFKNKKEYFITSVVFETSSDPCIDISYDSLQKFINASSIEIEALTPKEVFDYVSSLRRNVLPDHNIEFNAGSFFKNLILEADEFKKLTTIIKVPFYENNSHYKIPSGFLIEKAGWKGKGLNNVKVSDKHSLVLTTNGNLGGKEVVTFANSIIDDIYSKFKVKLEIEPTLI